ncbi:hypothetical protein MAP00_000120 [Monascus purpureus]|nr:hypothetical protein MAP00_000120 [Monascus purpureus]
MATDTQNGARQTKDEKQLEQARKLKKIPWCEQYERMISGMLYDSLVPELAKARFQSRAWCHRYNTYFPSPDDPAVNDFDSLQKLRATWLRSFMGSVKDDEVFIEPPFFADYGCNIMLGERFYANFNLTIIDDALVTIGDRVMFGPNVSILAATHETGIQSRRDNIEYAKPITIGDDCWLGANVVVLPGVEIGRGCTIGAGSVVTRSIPEFSVAVGSPARVIKKVTPLE